MRAIDLNADVGEGMGNDLALLGIVTSVSIATGAHAGGGAVLDATAEAAVAAGVAIGAHPSYRDREGFGRRSLLSQVTTDLTARREFIADLADQIVGVAMVTARFGGVLTQVKPHGALYNEAVADDVAAVVVATAVGEAAQSLGQALAVVTQPNGELAAAADRVGLRVVTEGFIDRGYDGYGRLVPRGTPGALLVDTAAMVDQALGLAAGEGSTVDGQPFPIVVQSLCVHGDTPGAVLAARMVRDALVGAGWTIHPASGL